MRQRVAQVQSFGILNGRPIPDTSQTTDSVQQPYAALTRATSINQPEIHPACFEKSLSSGPFFAGYGPFGTSKSVKNTNSTVAGNSYFIRKLNNGNVSYLAQNILILSHNCTNVTTGGPWRKPSYS